MAMIYTSIGVLDDKSVLYILSSSKSWETYTNTVGPIWAFFFLVSGLQLMIYLTQP